MFVNLKLHRNDGYDIRGRLELAFGTTFSPPSSLLSSGLWVRPELRVTSVRAHNL
jgi:hypothetical protein